MRPLPSPTLRRALPFALVAAAVASSLTFAAPPAADLPRAKALAQAKQWEELYLAFSATPPANFSDADRGALSALLARGAEALEKGDKVMAYSLADRAVQFQKTAPTLLLFARTARATDQAGAAEETLQAGLAAFPKDGRFPTQLAALYVDEGSPGKALELLERVPKKGKAETALVARAKKALAEESAARDSALAVERRINGGGAEETAPRGKGVKNAKGVGPGETVVSGMSWESSEQGGMRTRANARFKLRYFNNDRDFGQRAEYEGKVVEALEEAWGFSKQVLGQTREHPLDVVLYTREEFAVHQGAALAQMAAGLYSQGAIRMNDSAELTPQTHATLVHEYVHSVVDDLAGGHAEKFPTWFNEGLAEYVESRYQGGDGPPPRHVKALSGAVSAGQVPSLTALSHGMLIANANPGLLYAYSACAVRQMWKTGGAENIVGLIRDVSAGKAFEAALSARYDKDVAGLDRETRAEVAGR